MNTPQDKITEYTYKNEPIVVTSKRGRPKKFRNPLYVPQETKIEAASLYAVLGDFKQVSTLSKVAEKDLRVWSAEPWWIEVQQQIAREGSERLLSKINTVIDTALRNLEDRILQGDVDYIPAKYNKEGNCVSEAELVRVPIKGRDLSQIFHALTHQRNLMRGEPTSITQGSTTEAKLALLRNHFKELAQGQIVEGEVKVLEDKKNEPDPAGN